MHKNGLVKTLMIGPDFLRGSYFKLCTPSSSLNEINGFR